MGHNPTDPANVEAFRVFMTTLYILSGTGTVYALFGIIRTAATKLPIPRGNPVDPDLFPCDITPKLYSFDGRGRKVQKIVVFSLIGLLFGANWLVVQYITYRAGDAMFGWGLAPDSVVLVGHTVLLLTVIGIYARRALSHANKFPKPSRPDRSHEGGGAHCSAATPGDSPYVIHVLSWLGWHIQSQQFGIINKRNHPQRAGDFLIRGNMEQLNGFTWEGQNGERLRFADLPPNEQRVALIASGALLRGGTERQKSQQDTEDEVVEQIN